MAPTQKAKLQALVAVAFLTALGGIWFVKGGQAQSQPGSSEPLVIQGGITGIHDAVLTVKTPNGYPGQAGGHALFVTAGSVFKVDISRARVLLPDGKQIDRTPLAVGDRVLLVLTKPDSGSSVPGSPESTNQTYFASIIERIVPGDKVVSH